tara:strand:+ start:303 stop:530 length:228 start_codon:yes stop_codon:yes gene_type:complete
MVKQVVLILFLLTSSVNADCVYEASGEVQGDKIINKVEKVVCDEEEKSNFVVSFLTEEKYQNALIMLFGIILENI